MTLPEERYRALMQMSERLHEIAYAKGPIKKRELRREIGWLLRHYPMPSEIERMAKKCPDLLKP